MYGIAILANRVAAPLVGPDKWKANGMCKLPALNIEQHITIRALFNGENAARLASAMDGNADIIS